MDPSARRPRLEAARLYVVTGARVDQGDLVEFLAAILGAGVDVIQLREKEAEAGDLLRWGEVFREAADRHGALFTVNDRPDVALALGADGVHVGQNDLAPSAVRPIVGTECVVGVSTHTIDQIDAAVLEPVDYVAVGPVFGTSTKRSAYEAVGLERVRDAARKAHARGLPIVAIGGITLDRAEDVIGAGAASVAVISDLLTGGNPEVRVRDFVRRLGA